MKRKHTLLSLIGAGLLSAMFVFCSTPIRYITNTQELQDLLKAQHLNAVIKFSSEECPFCEYLDPLFAKAAHAYNGPVILVSVMIPSDKPTRTWYKTTFGFATVPTVVYYRDGQKKYVHGSENKTITDNDILNNIARVYSA